MLIPEEAFIKKKPLFYNYNTVFSYIVSPQDSISTTTP